MPFTSVGALTSEHDVCVIGAGPAGLVSSLILHERGLRVLIVEAGGKSPIPGSPDILAAKLGFPEAHDPTSIVSASAFGGSSHWWGGRIVPFDPVDFRHWPISHAEMAPWYDHVSEMMGCERVVSPPPGAFSGLQDFHADIAESWAVNRNLSHRWSARFGPGKGPDVLLNARATGFNRAGARIESLRVLIGGQQKTVRARRFIIAGGGLGSLRLMLMAQREHPDLFGGPDGPLGRGYMGHLTGSISNLTFSQPADADAFGFTHHNSFAARRRIMPRAETVTDKDICNIAFWLDGPRNEDPSHGSAASSARYLAASAIRVMAGKTQNFELSAHVRNVSKAPLSATLGLSEAAWTLAKARVAKVVDRPKRFRRAAENSWRMVYHAEQPPHATNRIGLSDELDSVGLPKLDIKFRFTPDDVQAVVRAHQLLDADLRNAGAGSISYTTRDIEPSSAVMASARDGYHQLGGAIISDNPKTGIVDRNCDVHGLENLSVVAGCVFPSGSQANPTLTVMALGSRLADRIATLSQSTPRLARADA